MHGICTTYTYALLIVSIYHLQADYIVAAQTIELYSQMVDTHGKSLVTYILQVGGHCV